MSLFQISEDNITLTKDIQKIQIFKDILEREDSDKVLAYIYHRCDWGSPYSDQLEEEREHNLKQDFLDGEEPDEQIEEACEKYKRLAETPSLKLLKAARRGAHSLREYFETIDPSMADNPGREAKDLMKNLKDVGDLLSKFDEWEELIKKEQDKAKTRKGVTLSKYNK
jgi:hypothetical protein